jgi:hypothetical protein
MTDQELLARLQGVARDDFATIDYAAAQRLVDVLTLVSGISGPIRSLRLKTPRGLYTQDFHTDRLNVHVDAHYRIVKFTVG